MACFVCRRSVIVRVYDQKGREFCGYNHLEEQKKEDEKPRAPD